MYHIGSGDDPGRAVNCSKGSARRRNHQSMPLLSAAAVSSSSARPFEIHYAKSLNGPWIPLTDELASESRLDVQTPRQHIQSSQSSLFTLYPGVDNVGQKGKPSGGVWLFESHELGTGKAFISFGNFSSNPVRDGALAWDACGGPPLKFDNGHPIEITGKGSAVGSLRVQSGNANHSTMEEASVFIASGCAVRYPGAASDLKLLGPYRTSSQSTPVPAGINYLEIAGSGTTWNKNASVRRVGVTQDAEGCRGACEIEESCTSYTWRASSSTLPGQSHQRASGDWADVGRGEGDCFLRSDFLWFPNSTIQHEGLANATVVSGRPWHFDGDNPAPLIDPESGQIRVLYRTDVKGGSLYLSNGQPNTYHTASLIGQAVASSWRGPYSMASAYGGSISNQQYPFDENEDPFLFKTKRGWHALFHANTWVDSRGNNIPVADGAGRLAYSADGLHWTYASTPPYNGTITFANGTTLVLARMERPVLLFDEIGRPTHLINGVQPFSHPYTFTLIQEVAHD